MRGDVFGSVFDWHDTLDCSKVQNEEQRSPPLFETNKQWHIDPTRGQHCLFLSLSSIELSTGGLLKKQSLKSNQSAWHHLTASIYLFMLQGPSPRVLCGMPSLQGWGSRAKSKSPSWMTHEALKRSWLKISLWQTSQRPQKKQPSGLFVSGRFSI